MVINYEDPKFVSIKRSRWTVYIVVEDKNGQKYEWVASADNGLTEGSGIYFAEKEDYEEDIERVW